MITKITNHVEQAIAKLTTEFRKPRAAQHVASHVRPWQAIEDAAWEVYEAWDVDTCDETRLTELGDLVGQPRVGTLDEYRLFVKARIAVNRSSGRIPDVARVARILLGPITYSFAPQTMIIQATNPTAHGPVAARLIQEAMSVTYRSMLVSHTDTPGRSIFRYSSVNSAPLPAWGSVNAPGTGGVYASVA